MKPTQTRYWVAMGYDHTTALIKAEGAREHSRWIKASIKSLLLQFDVTVEIKQKRRGSSKFHVMENGESVFSGFEWQCETYMETLLEEFMDMMSDSDEFEQTNFNECETTYSI